MKITMTVNEIKNLVADHFNVKPDELEFHISKKPKKLLPNIYSFLKKMEAMVADKSQKIQAIKCLRDTIKKLDPNPLPGYVESYSLMGLGAAKFAVENWAIWDKKIKRTNKLPDISEFDTFKYN